MRNMGQKKKLHHFVAQSYLRGFSEGGMLWGWFREPNEIRGVHIGSVAAEHGFYDLRLADGTPCDELEDALAVMDGMTPEIIRVATSDDPDEATLEGVRRLYATTLARNHQGRDRLLDGAAEMRERVGQMYDADFPNDERGKRDWAIDYVMREVWEVPNHLAPDPQSISRLNILALAADILNVMPRNVCILRSSSQNFLASDAPCGYFDPAFPRPEDGAYSGPRNWESPTLELTMPLDRRHAALIANRPLPRTALVNFDGVRVVNARTAFFAKRFVLAYPTQDIDEAALFQAQVLTERTAFDTPLLEGFPLST